MVETFAHMNSAGTSVVSAQKLDGGQGIEPAFWELESLIAAGHPFDIALAIMIARCGGRHDEKAARLRLTAWAPRPANGPAQSYWQKRVEAERRA